jgi:hypothetical protein
LKLTLKEIDDLINQRIEPDQFEEIFNDIPMYHPEHVIQKGETHRNYIEDDGRERRWFIFKDKETDIEHCINYTYNTEWSNELDDTPSTIEIVTDSKDSSLYIEPKPVIVPEKIMSPAELADDKLCKLYQSVKAECRIVSSKEKLEVPKSRINELINLLKQPKFGIADVRAIAYPICIEFKLEEKSFWNWIQVKRGVWKA